MIVVTGANGRLGRLVAAALVKLGAARGVKLASRDQRDIEDLGGAGFATAQVDFKDPDSMRAAFDGARTVLMISMSGPVEERIPCHRACIGAAGAASVGRIVYTSRVNPAPSSRYAFAAIHAATEDHIRKAAIRHTIVRNNEYAENILPAMLEASSSGHLVAPGATGLVPHVAVREIAEALATVALDDGHAGKTYDLNGPEALSRDQVAALLARVAGRPISAGPTDAAAFAEIRLAQGRPPYMAQMAASAFEAIDAGEFARVRPDLGAILGRRARSLRDAIDELAASV